MEREDPLLEQWKKASELHQHEDDLYRRKFRQFMTINALLVSVLGVGWSLDIQYGVDIRPVVLAILAFGALISFVQTSVQERGGPYQNYQIAQAKQAENDLKEALEIDGERVFSLYQKGIDEQELVDRPKHIGKISAQPLVAALGLLLML